MPTDEEPDLCEFGIVHKECYFCGQPRTILFNEHYYFCPNCSAVYTFMIVQKANCEHIKEGVPCAVREPWYKRNRTKPYILEANDSEQQFCQICQMRCLVDGW